MRILRWATSLAAVAALAALAAGCCGPSVNHPWDRERFEAGAYRVGAGDQLRIAVWGNRELTGLVTVRPDGQITMPLVGDVAAAEHTPDEIRADIARRLTRFLEGEPNVSVAVNQVNSYRVYVTGRVNQPGEFSPESPITVLQALALARGWNEFADVDRIVIMRRDPNGTRRIPFVLTAVVECGALEQNITLLPGDTVVVP
jgi:polysaccharide export outer membrane protein